MTTKTPLLLKAPLFAVSDEWEYNGYDDSDFYRAMFDWHTGEIRKVETGSTRYATGHFAVVSQNYAKRNNLHGYVNHAWNPATRQFDIANGVQVGLPVTWFVTPEQAPESVLERAEQALADRIFQLIHDAEHREIMEPKNANRGDILRLSEPHNSRKTKQILPAGTRIRVNECSNYTGQGTRDNRSIIGTIVGHPEQLVRVPLAKCRLDREPESDLALRERARELAKGRRFEQCWGRVF